MKLNGNESVVQGERSDRGMSLLFVADYRDTRRQNEFRI